MGRDGTPRQRQRADLERKLNLRRAYDRILIVCEGSRTEPLYFAEICSAYRLPTANIVVRPSEMGTAPIQVVQYAQQLFEHGDRHRKILSRAFERVFAVFDRDEHPSFHEALRLAESLDGKLRNDEKKAPTFQAIASIPSFELWLLLHFEDVHAPLHRDEALQQLKAHLPGYAKGAGNAFEATRNRLSDAARRARQLAARCSPHNDIEPYTGIGELVELLTTLKDRQQEARRLNEHTNQPRTLILPAQQAISSVAKTGKCLSSGLPSSGATGRQCSVPQRATAGSAEAQRQPCSPRQAVVR